MSRAPDAEGYRSDGDVALDASVAAAPLATWCVGEAVEDVCAESEDAEFVLTGDEFYLSWRRCRIKADDLCSKEGRAIVALDGETGQEASDRWEKLRRWISEAGSIEAALARSPILAAMNDDGRLRLVDGWHRLTLAVLEHEASEVEALVGVPQALSRRIISSVEGGSDAPQP